MATIRVHDGASRALEHFEQAFPGALSSATHRLALGVAAATVRNIEGFKRFPPGTRRLARSFMVPVEAGPYRWILGAGAPVYATIHEYGGTIRPVHASMLRFQYPPPSGRLPLTKADRDLSGDAGNWVSVASVHISEKRYARNAVASVAPQAGEIIMEGLRRAMP